VNVDHYAATTYTYLRPESEYTGPTGKTWIPLAER